MDLYSVLAKLNISYEHLDHKPVFTVEDAQFIKRKISGNGCKNLLLTDNKSGYFLVIVEDSKRVDMRSITHFIDIPHLSFASETELNDVLGLSQGSVSPFGIINDIENKVTLIIDTELCEKRLIFPANSNTKTIAVDYKDLIRFVEFTKHTCYILNV